MWDQVEVMQKPSPPGMFWKRKFDKSRCLEQQEEFITDNLNFGAFLEAAEVW